MTSHQQMVEAAQKRVPPPLVEIYLSANDHSRLVTIDSSSIHEHGISAIPLVSISQP